jgi:cell division protein FtsQ
MLVDAEGVVLSSEKYEAKETLPVIVGNDAPQHVRELLALLNAAPSVKPQVAAAVRVGDRRWNVRLANNVTVMLPEENAKAAWTRFSRLVDREGLLTKAIRSVDMRMEDRVFIMPLEQQQNPITLTTARDT